MKELTLSSKFYSCIMESAKGFISKEEEGGRKPFITFEVHRNKTIYAHAVDGVILFTLTYKSDDLQVVFDDDEQGCVFCLPYLPCPETCQHVTIVYTQQLPGSHIKGEVTVTFKGSQVKSTHTFVQPVCMFDVSKILSIPKTDNDLSIYVNPKLLLSALKPFCNKKRASKYVKLSFTNDGKGHIDQTKRMLVTGLMTVTDRNGNVAEADIKRDVSVWPVSLYGIDKTKYE